MIPYIGDLSKQDAFVLKGIAEESKNILEFGVGASTQILTHYGGNIISVDTSAEWIERTKKNFDLIGITNEAEFRMYGDDLSGRYDFIFVDGIKQMRKKFAIDNWKYLRYGGLMAFHDTRKDFHIDYVSDFIKTVFTQIETVDCNKDGSNITVIKKRKKLKYVNWNAEESRYSWQYGRGDFNMAEFLKYKNDNSGI